MYRVYKIDMLILNKNNLNDDLLSELLNTFPYIKIKKL